MTQLRRWMKISSGIIETFCLAELKSGGRVVEGSHTLFEAGFPVRVVQHHQVADHIAEVHLDADDLWLCIDGEAAFVCGGRLVEPIRQIIPGELTFVAQSIVGGDIITLKKGDWFLIPAGQPHQPTTQGLAHLAIVKLLAREGRVRLDYLSKFN